MKSWRLLVVAVCALCFVACSDESDDDGHWFDKVEDGGFFLRANNVRFYYLDAQGNDLINPEDLTTLPVGSSTLLSVPPTVPTDYKDGYYNGHDVVLYDSEQGLHYYTATAYGDERQSTYTSYIYFKGEVDRMDIRYKYTDEVFGGKYGAKIISWKYNGTYVYGDDDKRDERVFVRKANGKTSVSRKR